MLLAGDELGNTQRGNNNAYCQDNDTTWLDWESADKELSAYVAELITLRRRFPQLHQQEFLHGDEALWWRADGQPTQDHDWHDPAFRCFQLQLDGLLLVFNTGGDVDLQLPPHPEGRQWNLEFASDEGLPQSVRLYS